MPITQEALENAGKMFIYLNLCPKFMDDWMKFYVDLFQNSSPWIILQTLNRLLGAGNVTKDKLIVDIVQKLFKKTRTILKLDHKSLILSNSTEISKSSIDEGNFCMIRKPKTSSSIYLF